MIQGIKQLKMDEAAVQFIDDISKADALLALQSKLKKNPRIQAVAKSYGIPIYVTKVIKIALALLVLLVTFFWLWFHHWFLFFFQSSSLVEIRKAVRALMSDHKDGLKDYGSIDNMKSSEKIDALEVIMNLLPPLTFSLKICDWIASSGQELTMLSSAQANPDS